MLTLTFTESQTGLLTDDNQGLVLQAQNLSTNALLINYNFQPGQRERHMFLGHREHKLDGSHMDPFGGLNLLLFTL